jgi:hypothetical protein
MAKIKQSAYKSTGDRAPSKPIPKLDTAIQRMSTTPKPMKKKEDQSSEDEEMFSPSPLSGFDSSQGSIVVPMVIQTRSGQTPKKEHHEVSHFYV